MIFFISAILLLATGLSEAEVDCDSPHANTCRFHPPENFPKDEREFNNLCDGIIQYLECVVKPGQQCVKYITDLDTTTEFLKIFKEVCDKDSHFYQGIVDNLDCIHTQIEDLGPYRADDALNYGSKPGLEILKGESSDCLHQVYDLSRISATLGKGCGDAVKEVFTDIFTHVIRGANACKEEVVDAFPLIVDLFEEEEEALEDLENAFEEKK